MTISREHPFGGGPRDPVRQFRGRMTAAVSIWAASADGRRAGWTVSSFLVAEGSPAVVIGLVDEDSDLATALTVSPTVSVSLLGWQHRPLADAFAGVAPAPGGVFRMGSWLDTDWGPVLSDSPAWLGARLTTEVGAHAGWALLVHAEIEHLEVADDPGDPLLAHLRGRYVPVTAR
jgi:flavin reductase (DIM6/NTAB) family NADH-FMN oxidoreductase RutF